MHDFTDAELVAFLDEALPDDRTTDLEQALRTDEPLRQRLIQLRGQETAGLRRLTGCHYEVICRKQHQYDAGPGQRIHAGLRPRRILSR